MSLAAVVSGADGIMLEVHRRPEEAMSDKDQTITPLQFENIIGKVRKLKDFAEKLK